MNNKCAPVLSIIKLFQLNSSQKVDENRAVETFIFDKLFLFDFTFVLFYIKIICPQLEHVSIKIAFQVGKWESERKS